ncbi:hypothetical protein [Limimaricola pyoseonensis]|uniref:Uncharacterized protein n=1 Tax=Limimaricola pyoseonensis TaxID=521013 RepID=A0A1G7KUD6_9RHOB|nr:hypothetical protein [Limimaricola pyoseonensis]SDF40349.1 hypothetical protein SAMN04488567_0299 [Limimaricola pyoseonensis]
MDGTTVRDALLEAIGRGGGTGSLLVLDPAPIHSLWISGHLSLLIDLPLNVVILGSIRDLFASRQNCRKGREVSAFLDRHTPPLHLLRAGAAAGQELDDRQRRPEERLAALARLQASGAEEVATLQPPVFLLVTDGAAWRAAPGAGGIHAMDIRDLALVAQAAGLIGKAIEIAHAIELPGEVTAFG